MLEDWRISSKRILDENVRLFIRVEAEPPWGLVKGAVRL